MRIYQHAAQLDERFFQEVYYQPGLPGFPGVAGTRPDVYVGLCRTKYSPPPRSGGGEEEGKLALRTRAKARA